MQYKKKLFLNFISTHLSSEVAVREMKCWRTSWRGRFSPHGKGTGPGTCSKQRPCSVRASQIHQDCTLDNTLGNQIGNLKAETHHAILNSGNIWMFLFLIPNPGTPGLFSLWWVFQQRSLIQQPWTLLGQKMFKCKLENCLSNAGAWGI